MDQRLQRLTDWVAESLGTRNFDIRPASADASFRRYFRASFDGRSLIAMDAPPEKEDVGPYIAIARRLEQLGLNVPHIERIDTTQGFLLISDLGNRMYLPELSPQSVERLYGDALRALLVLQTGGMTDRGFLPPYSEAILKREMELFREWFLGRHLNIALTAEDHRTLDQCFHTLAQSALGQPQVWVHRDYHSRNLMVTAQNNPGILDFQDAVTGPITYDLVSLLRDCYIAWPRAQVEDWVRGYHALARQSGLPLEDDAERFIAWFDLMGVQRHLKAIGIFARLNHRDNKPGYLKDIPRTLGYVIDVSGRYPALKALRDLVAPLAERLSA